MKTTMKTKTILKDYRTGEALRPATEEETRRSRAAGYEGIIEVEVNGKRLAVYVEEQ